MLPAITLRDCSVPTQCILSFCTILRIWHINCYNEHKGYFFVRQKKLGFKDQADLSFISFILIYAIILLDTVHFLTFWYTDTSYQLFYKNWIQSLTTGVDLKMTNWRQHQSQFQITVSIKYSSDSKQCQLYSYNESTSHIWGCIQKFPDWGDSEIHDSK
jgi:hypothetical protein